MWAVLGTSVDLLHALLMAAWVAGFPLLFLRRYPRVTRVYALFSVAFVVVSQVSRLALGECVLTTLARWAREHPGGSEVAGPVSNEWFTIRLCRAIFAMAPTHHAVAVASELLAAVTALGVLLTLHRSHVSTVRRA